MSAKPALSIRTLKVTRLILASKCEVGWTDKRDCFHHTADRDEWCHPCTLRWAQRKDAAQFRRAEGRRAVSIYTLDALLDAVWCYGRRGYVVREDLAVYSVYVPLCLVRSVRRYLDATISASVAVTVRPLSWRDHFTVWGVRFVEAGAR